MRKNRKNKGFTLVELITVLVILSIIAAIAVPFFINYWKKAEFQKNEANAKTVYLAAESRLTYYRTSGQWEDFKEQVQKEGLAYPSDGSELNGRIYAITLDAKAYKEKTTESSAVLKLLEDYMYDKGFFDGAIGIEIDVESGEVYSAFYGTKCKSLTYEDADANGSLTMMQRDYDSRNKRLLGYYSTEDTVNVVSLKPRKLRITSVNLVNSEKLYLNWSSNVGGSQDVSYEITFCKDKTNEKLFSLTMSPYDMARNGWSGAEGENTEGLSTMATFELKDKDGKSEGSWAFPVTYKDNKYSLVLDAMMSVKVQAMLQISGQEEKVLARAELYDTSIQRLKSVAGDLEVPVDIYATVKAVSYAGTLENVISTEYGTSEMATSNTANSMFADGSKFVNYETNAELKITTFRHLSNIQYFKAEADFELKSKNMDWASVGTGLYESKLIGSGTEERETLYWVENTTENTIDFPAIEELREGQTLRGKGSKTAISNLSLGETSVIDANEAEKIKAGNITEKDLNARYLGLFMEISGRVEDVTLQDPKLEIGVDTTSAHSFPKLEGVGILAGRSEGNLKNVSVVLSKKMKAAQKADPHLYTVNVSLESGSMTNGNGKTAAVGGIVGVLAAEKNGSLTALADRELKQVTMEGRIAAILPDSQSPVDKAEDLQYGIGGIVGYAMLRSAAETNGKATKLTDCVNHAEISGNMFTGGIAGKVDSNLPDDQQLDNRIEKLTNMKNCSNDGLILCTQAQLDETSAKGHYFGGIVGYANKMLINSSTSASGRSQDFTYEKAKNNLLCGEYVGGIVGYGKASVVYNCSTAKNGYILGSDYVGGIAGGFGGIKEAIRSDGTNVSTTTNASYVIGKNYVGGIVGKNTDKVTLKDCINNGVVAGYGNYIGGIAGYNDNAAISDCASYLSDYDNSIFDMVVSKWEATGDYAGGIAGYNNGTITFSDLSEKITVKSVASIVVGNNYIGGIAGFNDVNGELDVHYTLIGGRIYAYGDCAGGAFGLNASTKTLVQELTIKPQSVQGQYYVGGCIGANVVNLQKDTEMSQIRTDNTLGKITGEAFVGGIVGYQRTYTADQLNLEGSEPIREALEKNLGIAASNRKMLPGLDEDFVPYQAVESKNTYTLTITTADNSTLSKDSNNMPISANTYVGGIVGYCEKNSHLVMKDCKNSGNISRASSGKADVSLKKYIQSAEITENQSVDDGIRLHFAGGITGVNLENEVIDNCANTGSVTGFSGIGGVVGLNAGLIYRCALNENFGNATLNYLGGIAGINIGSSNAEKTYGSSLKYTAGTIDSCTTAYGKTIAGLSNVGGIVGWNAPGGTVKENISYANITAGGSYIGGVAGRNSGNMEVGVDAQDKARNIDGRSGEGIGGIVGINEASGSVKVTAKVSGKEGELVAVGSQVTIHGNEKVGGIVGINQGTLGETTGAYLTCQAKLVRATKGVVGGIAGTTSGSIQYARNRSENVSADSGMAGGIVAENTEGKTVTNCGNYGNVTSSDGYAGGIAALNEGTIANCTVSGSDSDKVTIKSRGTKELGAVTALNKGTITASAPAGNVVLDGQATIFGGITGVNTGTVGNDKKFAFTDMPELSGLGKQLTVGGVVGQNEGTVQNISVKVNFKEFNSYQYLGGIAGQNGGKGDTPADHTAAVKLCDYSGMITEKGGTAGNCYGGIAGINYADLEDCQIKQITMNIVGVYTATSTSTAEQKERLATHAGGIAGKNETSGVITGCLITDTDKSSMSAQYGMLGGVTGFNKGSVALSGSDKTADIMKNATNEKGDALVDLTELSSRANAKRLSAESEYVSWKNNAEIENLTYNGRNNKPVSADRMKLIMSTNGNIGGITAYNGTDGAVEKCVSGNWFINNKSEALSVGTGGIIGMNESEKDLNYLVNGAFVGRQLKNAATNRFAGGIIGNQNNAMTSDWKISYCINYGTIYCYNSHYSGGIMGQWTGSGGTIEKCVNYGMLQTTCKKDWVGASGGIVAQLYHAYKGQEYNIISCGNYGNIFKKSGADGDGANDSAGILGNVTTYYVDNANKAEEFYIQIMDCFNAPGVQIHSNSMASGIFGFLSSDNPNQTNIANSSWKVSIRIERCRNFAKKLKGSNYISGIFGDRSGTDGWKNTVVKDCYTVRLNTDDYNSGIGGNEYVVISRGLGNGAQSDAINRTETINNYFLDGTTGTNAFTDLVLYHGTNPRGNGRLEFYSNWGGTYGIKNKYQWRSYVMYDGTEKRYFVAMVNQDALYGAYHHIEDNGDIRDINGELHGRILFYIDGTKYSNLSDITTNASNIVFINSRTQWWRQEKITENADGINKISAPQNVTATVDDGKVELKITTDADPFMYLIQITDEKNQVFYHRIYTENTEFDLSSEMSGDAKIRVQAVSMYENVESSDWVDADTTYVGRVLPDPDVQINLVPSITPNTSPYHAYRFSLNNLSDYMATDANGNPLYPNWKVEISVPGASDIGTVTLDSANTTVTKKADSISTDITYQMTAKASVKETGSSAIQASKEVSTPIYLPKKYKPVAALSGQNAMGVKCQVEGTTLDDLAIKVELDSSKSTMETPPVYRVELVGDWEDSTGTEYKDVVFAQSDVLIVSGGQASAILTDFADYLARGKNFKIRIWYAASGLGPVYTYYPVNTEAEANVKELIGETDGTPEWNYIQSTVLKNTGRYFDNYQKLIDNIFTWLDAPVLDHTDTTLTPDMTDGALKYTFTWDTSLTDSNPQYEVSLVGIDAEGREVVIDTGDAYKQGDRKLVIDGSDWNYTQVKLKVTRIGNSTGKTPQIGLSSTGTYTIKPRLSQPGQAAVNNIDVNELGYELTWAPISPESAGDCAGYQAYIRAYNGNTLGAATKLGDLIPLSAKTESGTYAETVNLEDYAGQRVVIYLVAEAVENGAYIRSVDGVTTELQIPNRLPKPNVSWRTSWKYSQSDPMNADAFEGGSLRVNLTADQGSIPPGGSAYLLKAYVYDTEEEAKASTVGALGRPIAYYPPGSIEGQEISNISPVQMDMASSTSYYHDLKQLSIKYAGKWVVFYARISSGNGNVSSKWTKSESAYQLPYVKLSTPTVVSGEAEKTAEVEVTNTPNVPGTVKQWNVKHTTLLWDSVDCADVYDITLNGKVADQEGTGKKDLTGRIRILENVTSDESRTPQVQYSADGTTWNTVSLAGSSESGWSGTLGGYSVVVRSNYNDATGGVSYYENLKLTTDIRITVNTDGTLHYELFLPDVTEVTSDDNMSVTNANFAITQSATVQANVQKNINGRSDAYTASDNAEIKWNN